MINRTVFFNKYYKQFNIASIVFVICSILLLAFKGLNYGIDFKGGTLIELRSNDSNVTVSKIRSTLLNMNLGDVSVKKFGNENDFLIKFEKKDNNLTVIEYIKDKWSGLVLSEVKQIGEGEGAKCFPEGDRSNNKGLLRSAGVILKIEYEW